MIRSRISKRKPLRLFFVLLATPVLLGSGQASVFVTAAESNSTPASAKKPGWFGRFKKGNMVTRAMTYDIAKNQRNAVSILKIDGKPLNWFQLDDGVMGGQSQTELNLLVEDDKLHFRGTINCNGGGFTSIRATLPEGALASDKTGLKIRYRGDGKTYKVIISNAERGGPFSKTPSWQTDLPTTNKQGKKKNDWDETIISFADLVPAYGGGPRSQPSEEEKKQCVFDPLEMKEIGLMLSLRLSDGTPNPLETFGEGIFPFSLLLDSIMIV